MPLVSIFSNSSCFINTWPDLEKKVMQLLIFCSLSKQRYEVSAEEAWKKKLRTHTEILSSDLTHLFSQLGQDGDTSQLL